MRIIAAMSALLIAGCSPGYGGACETIPLGSRVDELPHGELTPVSVDAGLPAGFYRATPDLQCCDVARTEPCTTSEPCSEILGRLRVTGMSGKYVGGPCQSINMGTTLSCTAYVDERDHVVALKTFCAD